MVEAVADYIRFFLFEEAMRDPENFLRVLQQWMGLAPLPWSALQTARVPEER